MRSRGQQCLLQERVDLDVGIGDRIAARVVPALVFAAEIFPGDGARLPEGAVETL